MAAPLAYHITWTTYGTWLHGDKRGWLESGRPGVQQPNAARQRRSIRKLSAAPVYLDQEQRAIVTETIKTHCEIRRWTLHAVNVRTNHVHAVVTAPVDFETVMNQLKAWCTRRLNEQLPENERHHKWWTEHGSTKWINDESYLRNVIRYVLEGQ